MKLYHPIPDLAALTDRFTAYQEHARALDLAADRLFDQIAKAVQAAAAGEAECLGVLPYQQPAVVMSLAAYHDSAAHEELAYVAWLQEVTRFLRRDWAERIELVEVQGWYVVVERQGETSVPVYHRTGAPVEFHSRQEGVLWLHHRAVTHVKGPA